MRNVAHARINISPFKRKLKSLHHLNMNFAGWHFDRSRSTRWEIVRLKRTFVPIVSVSTADPRISRSQKLSRIIGDRNACWCWLSVRVSDRDFYPSVRLQVLQLARDKMSLPASWEIL